MAFEECSVCGYTWASYRAWTFCPKCKTEIKREELERTEKAEARLKDAEYRWQCERERRMYLEQMLREIKGRAIQGIQYRPKSALFDIKERIEKFETEKTPAEPVKGRHMGA